MTVRTVKRLEDLPSSPPETDTYVVVDVILASTAVVSLLDEGVEYVRTFAEADEALRFKRETENAVLVGEQAGAPIDGFDLLPVPSRFSEHELKGARVGMLTTNGTRAVERLGAGDNVYFGSTVNAGAVASEIDERGEGETWLVAAGRYGEPTPEDTAGVELIRRQYEGGISRDEARRLRDRIRGSDTAGWIEQLGLGEEIDTVLDFDSTDTVPRARDGVFVSD